MENEIQTVTQTEIQPESETPTTDCEKTDKVKCLNCGTEFQGNFCPECGQDAKTSRFTLRFIWNNLLVAVLGRDGGIGYTIKNLFSRPGKMIVEMLDGKRRKYVSPFPMLFLALTLYVLIFTVTGSKGGMTADLDMNFTNNSTANTQISLEINRILLNAFHFYLNHYTLCYMLTLPLFVFAARICYGKENRKRYNRAEYIVAIVYAMVMLVLYRCVINLIYPFSSDLYGKMAFYEPFAIIIALTACFGKMMGFSTVKTIWRSTLTAVLYYFLLGTIIMICAVAIGFFIFFKYMK